LSGREVARIGGQPKGTVARVLQRLVEHGLVDATEAGSGAALLYVLNREHLVAASLEALVTVRRRLIERIEGELATWSVPPHHASLFGSVARGDGGTHSDVDLFLVRPMAVAANDPRKCDQLDRLAARVERWAGNHAGLAEVSLGAVARLARERPPVVGEIEREAITLQGAPAHRLLAGDIS
jgi:predicted nucleotidyltransferase